MGIVLAGRGWRERLAATGAAATGEHVAALRPAASPATRSRGARAGSPTPSRGRARSAAGSRGGPGPDWLLVGDAAGFLDPFTGEGLHRALVSARLAADAIDAHLRGDAGGLAAYDRAMRRPVRDQGPPLAARPGVPRPARACSSTRPGASPTSPTSVRRWAS